MIIVDPHFLDSGIHEDATYYSTTTQSKKLMPLLSELDRILGADLYGVLSGRPLLVESGGLSQQVHDGDNPATIQNIRLIKLLSMSTLNPKP